MKKMKTQDAVGQVLCHDITAILENGFKGVLLKRGHVITEEDVPRMLDIGKYNIFVWDPEAVEVLEEDAALAVSEVLCGDEILRSAPSEGKIGFTAAHDGLFCINHKALTALNAVPDYTVACISGYTPVRKGDKLCGARIVPLTTKRENVDRAVAVAKENYPILSVLPYKPLKCAVIITGSEVYYGRIQDRFEPIMTAKLQQYGGEILGVTKCPDDLERILAAIDEYKAKGAELICLTGGMSVDPDDLTPTAIRSRATAFITQGVPMQPDNMLTMAYSDDTMLVGVPGASMHSPITSFDLFLPRFFAGLRITREQIEELGNGGLCRGCKPCHFPNCGFGRH
ncbi:MAG: molybdopterin-binding protein [Oscillospiraceae bacterium]|nr:molybdopterin-binding protein [Oscillospiraceae bacterium]